MSETSDLHGKKVLVIGYTNDQAKEYTLSILNQLRMEPTAIQTYVEGAEAILGAIMQPTPNHTPEHYDAVVLHDAGRESNEEVSSHDIVATANNAGIPVLVHSFQGIDGSPAVFRNRVEQNVKSVDSGYNPLMFDVLQRDDFNLRNVAESMPNLLLAAHQRQQKLASPATPPATEIDPSGGNNTAELGVVSSATMQIQ